MRKEISDALEESYAAIDFGPESEDSGSELPAAPPPPPPEPEVEHLTEDDEYSSLPPPPPPPPLTESRQDSSTSSDETSESGVETDTKDDDDDDAASVTSDEKVELRDDVDVVSAAKAGVNLSTNFLTSVVAGDEIPGEIREESSLGSLPGPPSGFNDDAHSSTSSSDDESDAKNDASDTVDNNDEEDEDMLAQRGPAVPVLAGPMKFSIASYKDRMTRERPEPIKILDPEPETCIPTMPVPESPPPPTIDPPVLPKKAASSSFELPEPPVKSPAPVKFDAILLPEKPVYIVPKSPRSTSMTPTPPPPMLPLKSELRKSADSSDFRFPSPPPPLPTKPETLKQTISVSRTVSPAPKPDVPVKPPKEHLSGQVIVIFALTSS